MLATPDRTFSQADQLALNHFFLNAADSGDACRLAKVEPERFHQVLYPAIAPYLRGNEVNYNRFVNAKNTVDADPIRFDYELRMAQLNRQHRMCIESFQRSDNHAWNQYEQYKQNPNAQPLHRSAVTGNIRFLLVARAIRNEMERLEAKINERIEELTARQDKAQVSPTRERGTAEGNSQVTSHHSTPPQPPHPTAPSQPTAIAENPTNQAKTTTNQPSLAEVKTPPTKNSTQSAPQSLPPAPRPVPILSRHDLLASLSARHIPEIAPPPRKFDKYAKASAK